MEVACELQELCCNLGLNRLSSQTGTGIATRKDVKEDVFTNEFDFVPDQEAMVATTFCESGNLGRSETILLVEDEVFVRTVTAEVLKSAGYTVLTAGSAAEALHACRKWQPVDLLLADIVMPGMSGCKLASEFEGLHPLGRVLLMSGYAAQLAKCESSPYRQTYLAKPFTATTLVKKVREALDGQFCDTRATG